MDGKKIASHSYNTIIPWEEPCERVRKMDGFIAEMSLLDHGFLCGLLRDERPENILEIGVAEGGTTALIVTALDMLRCSAELHSVDYNADYYRNKKLKTGYFFIDNKDKFTGDVRQSFYYDTTVAGCVESLSEKEFDMAVIDTTHVFPGEVLDFLSILPFLKDGAVVVLHDVNLNYTITALGDPLCVVSSDRNIATKMLFAAVTGDKYLNIDDNFNIAAFRINAATRDNIKDILFLLSATWAHHIEAISGEYRAIIAKYYDEECLMMYDMFVRQNQTIKLKMATVMQLPITMRNFFVFPFNLITRGSKICLYGAGAIGTEIYKWCLSTNYCSVIAWVDKAHAEKGDLVAPPTALKDIDSDYVLIATDSDETCDSILHDIEIDQLCPRDKVVGPVLRELEFYRKYAVNYELQYLINL